VPRTPSVNQLWRRAVVVTAIGLCLAGVLLAASQSARARTVRQTSFPCYSTAQASTHLGASNIALLRRVLPCALRRTRGGVLTTSAELSADATSLLNRITTLTRHNGLKLLTALTNADVVRFCGRNAKPEVTYTSQDSSPPPILTPALVATEMATEAHRGFWSSAGTVFGLAYAKHVEYDDPHKANAVSYFILAVNCG
jgi:hypothetical protein